MKSITRKNLHNTTVKTENVTRDMELWIPRNTQHTCFKADG